MATATNDDLSKLSVDDLRDKLGEVKKLVKELTSLENRSDEQEQTLIDRLDEFDDITAHLTEKTRQDIDRRIQNVDRFDTPRQRRTGSNPAAPGQFNSFGEKLSCIAQARISGQIDPRLRIGNALGANEASPADGGFMVGPDFETDLQSKIYGDDTWLGMIPRTPISAASNQLKLRLLKETSRADGSRHGAVRAYWDGEATAVTASQREYEEVDLALKKLMAVSYATSELLEDWSALESELTAGYSEEMGFKLGDAVVNGDGVGKPVGLLNAACKVTVSAETGQTSSDPLLYENIVKMWARLHPRSQGSSVWLIDQMLLPYLMTMGVTNGMTGTPVYLPPNGAAGAPFGTLLGRPVFSCEYTQAANTEGDIILFDPMQYRLIEKGGIKGVSSVHVAFLTDEVAYRFTYRVNGAPKWRSALTPKNSGNTLSTIVTLATRT